jgi:hypothetical protein
VNRSTVAAAALAVLAPALTLTAPAATAAPASSDARAADVALKVVAKISAREAIANQDIVKIKGHVKPRAAGQTVVLQQRKDGRNRWVKSGTSKVRANGSFVLKDDPSTAGVRFYRVLVPAANGFAKGLSRELQLSVWAWGDLVYRAAGANLGITRGSSPLFGTESYPASLSTQTPGTPGFVEYTLGGKCRSLRATYALTDDSATGATGTVNLSVDGALKVTHALATGVIVKDEVVDVTGAFRIRFDAGASASPVGTAAVGTPEVLCLN